MMTPETSKVGVFSSTDELITWLDRMNNDGWVLRTLTATSKQIIAVVVRERR